MFGAQTSLLNTKNIIVKKITKMASSTSSFVRPANKTDCAEIIRLIKELAVYEKMPDGPKIDAKGNK